MENCLFCKIVRGAIPAEIVLENEHALAFKDIHPAANVHALVIPRKHMTSVADATGDDRELLGAITLLANDVAKKLGVAESGYRLVVNTGVDAGQSVFHLHMHVLGGRPLAWPPG
ncbi:MAG: histidine triad nucleotide-binding protein [Polyangiaceae bacterium]